MRRNNRRSFPLVVVSVVFAALCAPSLMASQSAGWSVVAANNAFVDHGKGDAASSVVVGANIGTGDRLTTGNGGALVLTRGEDLVTMAENSEIEIVDPQPSATTLIEQPYGHVEYHVTKEKVPHFQVDAPLLATIVKGTTFSVNASRAKSTVTVTEGRVVAKNRRTGASSSVGAGERGAVESGGRGVDVGAAPSNGGVASPASSSSAASVSGGDDGSSGNSGNGNGNGNGNSGNGNGNSSSGNGKGNNGNGNGNGGGNGNSGNGNGNGGGNGKSNGGGNGKGKNK